MKRKHHFAWSKRARGGFIFLRLAFVKNAVEIIPVFLHSARRTKFVGKVAQMHVGR